MTNCQNCLHDPRPATHEIVTATAYQKICCECYEICTQDDHE